MKFLLGVLIGAACMWLWGKPFNYCPDPLFNKMHFSFVAQNSKDGPLYICYKFSPTELNKITDLMKGLK